MTWLRDVAWIAVCAAALTWSAGVAAQPRDDAAPHDTSFQAIDALVHESSLVTLERTRCDAARPFDANECGELVARSLDDGAVRFRTAIPIRLRGLLQLETFALDDDTVGYLLRAHDRGCVVGVDGRVIAEANMPISTFDAPAWLTASHGALVFREHGGCSAYVVGRGDLAHGLYVRGVESHVYARLGEPHDTVCFGFRIEAVGEVRLGRRASRVLVAVASLHHPIEAGPPTLVAFDGTTVAYTTTLGSDGETIESTSMEGTRAIVIVSDGQRRRRVTVDARSGQRLTVTEVARPTESVDAGPTPDADTAPIAHDRRGIPIQRFPRCTVTEAHGRHRVRFDGREVVSVERRVLVVDQRGDRCVAIELGSGPTLDVVHVIAP